MLLYVILKGRAEVRKRNGIALLKKPGSLGAGQCFSGEMSLVTGKPRNADVVACTETYVLRIGADALNRETGSYEMRSLQFKFTRYSQRSSQSGWMR
ncbi:MAG: cyclic nucleotide-binding domain-containing protein [Thermodesulfovibrionales bacterium]